MRPSIETLLHGFVDAHAVVHTHADAIVSLTNNDRAADVLAGVYGKDVIALDYRRPGFKISREVADAIVANPQARALLLSKHGTITWGATVREAYEATVELITRAEDAIAERLRGRRVFGGPRVAVRRGRRRGARARWTCSRGCADACSRARRVIVGFDDAPAVTEFVSSADAPGGEPGGAGHARSHDLHQAPAVLRGSRRHATDASGHLDGGGERRRALRRVTTRAYVDGHRGAGVELLDALPRVVLVPGLGMFTAGRDARTAGIVKRHLSPHDRRDRPGHRLRPLRLAHGPRRVRRRVLAARALQAHAGAAGEGAGPADRAGHRRRLRHRPRRRAAPGRRGRARGDHRRRRRIRAPGGGRGHQGGRRRSCARPRHGRHQRGLGAGGVRGHGARLGRPRHPRVQRRHRALRTGGSHGAGRLGALVRGELDRPLPGGPRGDAAC